MKGGLPLMINTLEHPWLLTFVCSKKSTFVSFKEEKESGGPSGEDFWISHWVSS
jgi:hypothetical protein